ncbi:MAG: 1-(5-phosphoribosyl)-5-[(5-phosphoribosylamino)methylideneamino]imidazole-4-carboxamide isomerase [Candidatus Berkiellales bacterium]
MKIIPAIDIQGGKCVRLAQGRFENATEYAADPTLVAEQYALHATELHVVDLDGAKCGRPMQWHLLRSLLTDHKLNIQMGGGIRSREHIQTLLSFGVGKVVIGSMAITQIAQVKTWLQEFGGDKIILALDVQGDEQYLAVQGWQQQSRQTLWEILGEYHDSGLKHILCTDIDRDGMLSGPHFALYERCLQRYPQYCWLASGGVSSLKDLDTLNQMKVYGVIIGKALYEKKFTLAEAKAVVG